MPLSSEDNSCLADLRGASSGKTDPEHDRKRIMETKGGLLKAAYRWIIEHADFQRWRNETSSHLLWISGDPGKGKTMLLCGIIDELGSTAVNHINVAYFFCQAGQQHNNNATSVIRGLVLMLVSQQRTLLHHVRKKYDHAGKYLFEDINSWIALAEILQNILNDPILQMTYLIIDALDECITDRYKLLNFFVQQSSASSAVKWVVSSRNWHDIEERLEPMKTGVRLSLEQNATSISRAVKTYIDTKVHDLAETKKYTREKKTVVQNYLFANACDTFLWAALVCDRLEKIPEPKTLKELKSFPPGLDELYRRMIHEVCEMEDKEDVDLCKRVLAMVTIAYQPITLDELLSFIQPQEEDVEYLRYIIGLSGSVLTIREREVDLVHQSARDYLLKHETDIIFPSGIGVVHHHLFFCSLRVMSQTLKRDIYNLRHPGILIEEVSQPVLDPLAMVRYSCLFWVQHLRQSASRTHDKEEVFKFLQAHLLHWLEALGLMGKTSEGIQAILSLKTYVLSDQDPNLYSFIHDAERFALYNRFVIEKAPLQLYCSALVFAPETSMVRKRFKDCIPHWIQMRSKMQTSWNAARLTFEGHSNSVKSVAFSPDGTRIVSGSEDKTVRLWDFITGAALQNLEGHSNSVNSVAFSPDGRQIVSGSEDKTVRLWDAITGTALQSFEGHSNSVNFVAFTPDDRQILCSSDDETLRLWDIITGEVLQTLEVYSNGVMSMAFSQNGKKIVSGSRDGKIRVLDGFTGVVLQTLEGHKESVNCVAFSHDSKQVVSGHYYGNIRLWDTSLGVALQTLEGHSFGVTSVALSPNSEQIVSGSYGGTVRLWNARTGAEIQTFNGHNDCVNSVAFSPDGRQVVSGSRDSTVRVWDATKEASIQNRECHSRLVYSVAFSPDGKRIVSSSEDEKYGCGTPSREPPYRRSKVRQLVCLLQHSRQTVSRS